MPQYEKDDNPGKGVLLARTKGNKQRRAGIRTGAPFVL